MTPGAQARVWAAGSSAPTGAQMFALPEPRRLDGASASLLPRRVQKAYLRDVQDCASVLNWLQGVLRRELGSICTVVIAARLGGLWLGVSQRIERSVVGWGRPPDDLTPQAALQKLLRGRGGYDVDVPSNLASYDHALLSVPADVRDAPVVGSLLEVPEVSMLQDFKRQMLRPPEEVDELEHVAGKVRPYVDPVFQRSRRAYVGFIDGCTVRASLRSRVGTAPRSG